MRLYALAPVQFNPANGGISTKYIEGLENRLVRMESLLKLTGLLKDEDGDRTDLGAIEKRLADQSHRRSHPGTPAKSPTESNGTGPRARPSSELQRDTPLTGHSGTPRSSAASPAMVKDVDAVMERDKDAKDGKEREKAREEEVEELSDMMCSLVTNNCGETRYIGGINEFHVLQKLTSRRFFLGLLYIFAQRNTVGQREDRRQLVPRNDFHGGCGR